MRMLEEAYIRHALWDALQLLSSTETTLSIAMKVVALVLCVVAAASAGVIAPATTLVRTPSLDSAVIQSDRVGGNFAYSSVEGHAYTAVSPVVQNVVRPVGVSYTARQVPVGVAYSAPAYTAPAYTAVAAPAYTAYSAPAYSAYAAPAYSAYSTYSAPAYSAPAVYAARSAYIA